MSDTDSPNHVNRVQQRLRMVAEPLLSNSSLRDELTDAQAQALYNWALHRLEETAVRTASLPDEDALPVLEEKATAVKLIMQLTNDLVAHPGPLPDEDVVHARLVRLGKNLQWLMGGQGNRARRAALRQFRQQRDQLDRDAAFHLLLSALQAPTDAA